MGSEAGLGRPAVRRWHTGSAWPWSRPAIGLAIAIVSVAFYYVFLNRVDILVRELDDRARQVIELVSVEAQRHSPSDRRHIPLSPPEPLRQESRVLLIPSRPLAISRRGFSRCWPTRPVRRIRGHQHDADGRRDSLLLRVLHGRHPAIRLGRERIRGQRAGSHRGRAVTTAPWIDLVLTVVKRGRVSVGESTYDLDVGPSTCCARRGAVTSIRGS